MAERIILGAQVTNRLENIPDVQNILTECGCVEGANPRLTI
jgi:hypothetical protein